MTRKLIIALFLGAAASATAQKAPESGKFKIFPNDQTEVGVHTGLTLLLADGASKIKPGFGIGLYARKAIDYTFSLRGGLSYYTTNGEFTNANYRVFTGANAQKSIQQYGASMMTGTIDVLMNLGGTRFETGKRTINPYIFVGVGANKTTTDVTFYGGGEENDLKPNPDDSGWGSNVQAGVGIGFRLNEKVTLGLEQKMMFIMGSRADFLDGFRSANNDLPAYTNVRLGFNVGAKSKKPAPLWWTNPAEQIQNDIAELKARPKYDPTDTDSDGIIDMIDAEKESPAGARVDTRGVTLDSDADGVADFKDKEPFSPIGYKVDANGVAQVPKPNYVTEADVNRIVDAKLANFKATTEEPLVDWFLPMIHFDLNASTVKTSEYSNLAAVAHVLKSNSKIKVVVTGYTDKLSSDAYNDKLSYRRAQNTIDALVKRFGVSRDRLVLNYGGESVQLVPANGNSYMNRRVEFRVAKNEAEQAAPAPAVKSKKSYKGNKSGY